MSDLGASISRLHSGCVKIKSECYWVSWNVSNIVLLLVDVANARV